MASILLIDDDENIRSLLVLYLELAGHEVSQAENGFEGLDLVSQKDFDLVIVDLMMPVMDGFRFLQGLQQLNDKSMPVIVLSAASEGKFKDFPDIAQHVEKIQKPLDPEKLVKRIEELIKPTL